MARPADKKFNEMSPRKKFFFVCKICVFFLTLGFSYPNILVD
jgi:hypothetical protein